MKHDDASWHYGGRFPEDLPREAGGTHIGMFLAWAIINHLENEMHLDQSQEDLVAVRERRMTGRTFLFKVCDEKFCDDDLSDKGNAFAQWYYIDRYWDDYLDTFFPDIWAIYNTAGTVYHVADTWENFDKLAPLITTRYETWKACQGLGSGNIDSHVLMIEEALKRLEDEGTDPHSFVIFEVNDERHIFVQCRGGRGMSELYAEAVGNKYREKEYRLNAQQIAAIRALGWKLSRKYGNFYKWLPMGGFGCRLAAAEDFIRTLRTVYNVPADYSINVKLDLPDDQREQFDEPIASEILEKGPERVKKTEKGKHLASAKPSPAVFVLPERDTKNFMTPGQLLDQIRGLYLAAFAEVIESRRKDKSVRVVAEAAYSNDDGEVIGSGPHNLPLRNDIFIVEDSVAKESLMVDSERSLCFEPFSFDWDQKLLVTLSPFQWDWCQAKIFGLNGSPDWKPLVDWFMASFEEPPPSEWDNEFLGVVHFMSDPESDGDCYSITLDLGSAPVETFESLLDALVLVGAKSVEIGKFSVIEEE